MQTLTQTPTQNKPVHGKCRWIYRTRDGGRRLGVLEIHGVPYAVVLLPGGIELTKNDGTVYHVCTCLPHGWQCDCPDAEFRPRPGGCKHVCACRVGLAAIGVEPMPPAPSIPAATKAAPAELEDF